MLKPDILQQGVGSAGPPPKVEPSRGVVFIGLCAREGDRIGGLNTCCGFVHVCSTINHADTVTRGGRIAAER